MQKMYYSLLISIVLSPDVIVRMNKFIYYIVNLLTKRINSVCWKKKYIFLIYLKQ